MQCFDMCNEKHRAPCGRSKFPHNSLLSRLPNTCLFGQVFFYQKCVRNSVSPLRAQAPFVAEKLFLNKFKNILFSSKTVNKFNTDNLRVKLIFGSFVCFVRMLKLFAVWGLGKYLASQYWMIPQGMVIVIST